jgi:hypothetical protein
MAAYGRLARDFLLGIEREPTRLKVDLRRTAESDAEGSRIVEIEAHCCPFMDVSINQHHDRLVVEYSGSMLIAPVIDMIEERLRTAGSAAPRVSGERAG